MAIDSLESGREAMTRHAWSEAVEAYTTADGDGGLSPDDLEQLGIAAWWAGKPEAATEALERAYAGHLVADRRVDAARVAILLAYHAFRRLAGSVGGGWLARAGQLLEDEPESPSHAWLAAFHTLNAMLDNRLEEGVSLADRAIEVARRTGNQDALALMTSFKGMGLLFGGDPKAGFALIDEAATAAASGQLDLRVASDIYCNTIAACRNAGDLQRASQWADDGERWMRRNGAGGYPGICQVHRAELKMLHGQWAEAEQEARLACEELERFRIMDAVGFGQYEIGEVRLRMGDLEGAAEAFDRAYEYGHDAQPGLALLQLARGEIDEASRSIARALAATTGRGSLSDRATRGRLLPAQVDIALAAGDLETARTAADELESIAAEYDRPLFEAGALTAKGELLLGEQKPSEASPLLGRSWRVWQATDLPYESALARLHYAEAVAAEGDEAAARRDMRAARAAFERLGAERDLQRVDALLGESAPTPTASSKRATRTFMFTDIATSTDLIGVIGDQAWTELLTWHDRELRSAFSQHRGEVVNHTGDGFFVAFERAPDGIDCAIDIQRRLARHRREHGFAPVVRIGLHAAEATRQGRDYRGRGVHVAARLGAAAVGEEILASASVIDEAGATRYGLSEPRSLSLKGVAEPLEARSVDWRPGGR
jgi:class 3 adenylate cyclase